MSCDDKPLDGRCVVVTRAAEQAAELVASLEALGAKVLLLPLVAFAPPDDFTPLDRALNTLGDFDWLFLTSRNTVRFVAERAHAIGMDLAATLARSNGRPRIAVVGQVTERAVCDEGWRVDSVSSGRGSQEMVDAMKNDIHGLRVLLPRSDRATTELTAALADAGALPLAVVAYKTITTGKLDEAILHRLASGEVDAISFTSPSAFESLAGHLGNLELRRFTKGVRLAAIGPSTAAAIRNAGLMVAIEAPVSTAAGLAAAIGAYFAAHAVSPGGPS